jgi:DNA mismatch repair protein MutL
LAERTPIRLLDDVVISGIAAGEVIQRPAFAVKELVENALDAGARNLEIRYDDGERIDLSVADDGDGIPAEDLALAVRRHATSKLRRLDDLDTIATFGFRGEALASMAAVAEIELLSRTAESPEARGIRMRDGAIVDEFVSGGRVGTRVSVTHLFGNMPARRKFLKSATAEYTAVADVVRRFALLHPEVGYRLLRNGRLALHFPAVAEMGLRLRQVLDTTAATSLHPVAAAHAGMALKGVLSAAGDWYGSARRMFLFMNGRWVQDKAYFHAVMEGYRTYLMKGRYPAVALFLEVPGERVDVNVHPAKLEVRFADAEGVQRFVSEGVRETLRGRASPLGRWGLTESDLIRSEVAVGRRQLPAAPASPATALRVEETTANPPGYVPSASPGERRPEHAAQPALSAALDARLRLLGQIFDGYILCERDGELLMIDQHAAHERIVYERLIARLAQGDLDRQPLLAGMTVEVGGDAAGAIDAARAELLRAGWELERFGDEDVVVRAIPALCAGADVRALVERLAAEIVRTDARTAGEMLVREILATVACHTATRVGQTLGIHEQKALIEQIGSADFAAACPHGRPVARVLSRTRIERMFGR